MINWKQILGHEPLLILDDGHGMETAGKRTPRFEDGSFIHEDQYNRAVIDLMEKDAQRLGFRTLKVAPTDNDTPLKARTDLANKAYRDYKNELKSKGIDIQGKIIAIFYSQHYNAMTDTWDGSSAEGIGTYYYPTSKEGKKLAECVQKYVSQGTKQVNRGVIAANFHVLRETDMPAVLDEGGFMDDPREAKLMLDKDFQKEQATQAMMGICEYFEVNYEDETKPQTNNNASSNWGQAAVDELKRIGLITEDHKPENNVTWAEFATVISKVIKNVIDK